MRYILLLTLAMLCLTLRGDARPMRVPVTVTAYASSGSRTASGLWPQVGHCALSRDLERDLGLRFGARLHLEGLGSCTFTDRMHARWRKRLDLYLASPERARQFGIKHQVVLQVAQAARLPHP